ncbi:MAG: tRNA (adenosine(37)-N6)-dimethylallyltransferase MiaA [Candidatus Margulisbacteria bacterium]|nr:tRNA (adenosine(37)-N6)-dimethylallyltransferase MiaA [Candidatus Margulisiibacteriota bacterium]
MKSSSFTNQEKIPIIIGPTAIGKTEYALDLAQRVDAEIISADSMQVYKYMDVGTAKPDKKQLTLCKHHLISIIKPDEDWNLHIFLNIVRKLLASKDKKYIICGGTGLYIRALIHNFETPEIPGNKEVRVALEKIAAERGSEYLYKELQKVDITSADAISPQDKYRIIRALEVYKTFSRPLSELKRRDESYADRFQLICLNTSRENLYRRINDRVDIMIKKGLFEEVQMLLTKGYGIDLVSMQALGYKESARYLQGIVGKEECIELIKKRTRNFAKRQLTWYRSFSNINRVEIES